MLLGISGIVFSVVDDWLFPITPFFREVPLCSYDHIPHWLRPIREHSTWVMLGSTAPLGMYGAFAFNRWAWRAKQRGWDAPLQFTLRNLATIFVAVLLTAGVLVGVYSEQLIWGPEYPQGSFLRAINDNAWCK